MKKISKKIFLSVCSLVIAGALLTSCKKKDTIEIPDPYGGFKSSNEIEAGALKAHWTFDDTPNETISNIAPIKNVGTSYVLGVRGKALNLVNGYLLYPNFDALNGPSFGSITVSCWVNVDNNGSKLSNVFSLTQGTANQTRWNSGYMNMVIETNRPVAYDDTLVLHPFFATYPTGTTNPVYGENVNDVNGNNGVREVDFKTVHGATKWTHYVVRYDYKSSNLDVFANGVLVSNNNSRHQTTGSPAAGVGAIVTNGTNTQALIGAFASIANGFPKSTDRPMEGLFNGSIDELRFYNAPLTNDEIASLYHLELVGK